MLEMPDESTAARPAKRRVRAGALSLLGVAVLLALAAAVDTYAGTGILSSALGDRWAETIDAAYSLLPAQGVCMKMDYPAVLFRGAPNATIPLPLGRDTVHGRARSCQTWRDVRVVYTDTFYHTSTKEVVTATYTYVGAVSAAFGTDCQGWVDGEYMLSLAQNDSKAMALLSSSMDKPWDAGAPPVPPAQVCLGEFVSTHVGLFRIDYVNSSRCERSPRPWRLASSSVVSFQFASHACCDLHNCTSALLETSYQPYLTGAPGAAAPPTPPPRQYDSLPPTLYDDGYFAGPPPTSLRDIFTRDIPQFVAVELERADPTVVAAMQLGVAVLVAVAVGLVWWCLLSRSSRHSGTQQPEELQSPLLADQA